LIVLPMDLNPRRYLRSERRDCHQLVVDARNRAPLAVHLSDNDLFRSIRAQQEVHAELRLATADCISIGTRTAGERERVNDEALPRASLAG
jgi:hypothetical protein